MIQARFAGARMRRFVEGADRGQSTLLPECLDDWVEEDNPVRVIDAFVDALDLAELGFEGVEPLATGRPSYHPSALLKLYIYGYLNRVQSSRRLERETGRNVELMWLLGRLVPDHKHQGVAEATVIAPTPPGHGDICLAECVVAHQLTLISRGIEQRGDLGFGQLLSAH